jgi:hypothetical protein
MALPSSGTIAVSDINTEFKLSNSSNSFSSLANIGCSKYSSPYAMSDFYSKSYCGGVTSGLTIHLDAAHPSSAGGSTWYDISGNSNHYSGGGTYGTDYGGCYSFDGGAAKSGNAINTVDSFTMEVWVRPQATQEIDTECALPYPGISGEKYLIKPWNKSGDCGAGLAIGTNGPGVYVHGSSYMPTLAMTSTTISSTTFYQVLASFNGGTPTLYVNGSVVSYGCAASRTVYADMSVIGAGDYGYYTGDVSIFRFWNRTLSGSEVTSVYNATRNRYNI